jgi:hypothetical protein
MPMQTTAAIARRIGGLLLAVAGGCQPAGPAETPAKVTPPAVVPNTAATAALARPPASDTLHVVAEKVVQQLFRALAYDKLRPRLQQYTRKSVPTPSEAGTSGADSLVTYSAGRNSVAFLKSGSSPGGAMLLRCYLTEWPGGITGTIHLGMSKAKLGQVLNQPFAADVLLASEEEGYQKFYFAFNQDKLQAIRFESDYID